ncbi:unnamed protein product [Camellia sinensis]
MGRIGVGQLRLRLGFRLGDIAPLVDGEVVEGVGGEGFAGERVGNREAGGGGGFGEEIERERMGIDGAEEASRVRVFREERRRWRRG